MNHTKVPWRKQPESDLSHHHRRHHRNGVLRADNDNLEMTDQDRVLLLGMVRAILNENAPIVITHGPDTMVVSGQYLEQALPTPQVPIRESL